MLLDFYTVPYPTKLCASLSEIFITFDASLGNDSVLSAQRWKQVLSRVHESYYTYSMRPSGIAHLKQLWLINKCHLDNDNLFREFHVTYTNNTSTKDFGKIVLCSSPSTCPAPSQCAQSSYTWEQPPYFGLISCSSSSTSGRCQWAIRVITSVKGTCNHAYSHPFWSR